MSVRSYLSRKKTMLIVLFSVLLFHIILSVLTDKFPWSTNFYNTYSLQSAAWAQGDLELSRNYEWLELAIFEGKYYVSFPPFPSYILFPFSLFMGADVPDGFVAAASMILGALSACGICRRLSLSQPMQVFLPLSLYCSSNILQITMDAWVWFIAQNLAVTLTLLSFYLALCGKKGSSLLCLCAAVGCRPFQLIYLPVSLCCLYQKTGGDGTVHRLKRLFLYKWYSYIPALLLGLSYMWLNIARFGSPFEFGHNYLPEFVNSELGQFSLGYAAENFKSLIRAFYISDEGKISLYMFNGMNIFMVFPILIFGIYAFISALYKAESKEKKRLLFENLAAAFICALHIFFLICHKTMGGYHFGNRYICDLMPLVLLITAKNLNAAKTRKTRFLTVSGNILLTAVLLWGGLFNFYGVFSCYTSR